MAGRTLAFNLRRFLVPKRPHSVLRPLIVACDVPRIPSAASIAVGGQLRSLSTRRTTNPEPEDNILRDGCDFEHWLVVMEHPEPTATREELIDHYIKTLAQVVGSEQEARMLIYSVSTRHYFAFGATVSQEVAEKIEAVPGVRWVLPDSYLDPRTREYGGEPFINGEAVPYDPKYHEEWMPGNRWTTEWSSSDDDRPKSRNFEKRRENMQDQEAPGSD